MKKNSILLILSLFSAFSVFSQASLSVSIPSSITPNTQFTATFTMIAGGNASYTISAITCSGNCTFVSTNCTSLSPGQSCTATFTAGSSGTVQVSGRATGGNGANQCNPCVGTSLSVALPVELISFEAKLEFQNAKLGWQTASELNNEKFEIERSYDGRNFQVIGEVAGNGTTLEHRTYNFVDENPRKGVNYYRLRQVDFDGSFEFSDVQSVVFKKDGEISVYPTIVENELTVALPIHSVGAVVVNIYNLQGRLVHSLVSDENQLIKLSLPEIIAGQYLVEVLGEGQSFKTLVSKL